jgi:hypothetical protein
MALPAWRQALALALRASDGDVSGCTLPSRATRNLHSATAYSNEFCVLNKFNFSPQRLGPRCAHWQCSRSVSPRFPARAPSCSGWRVPHRRMLFRDAPNYRMRDLRRGFMDDGHLTFVTDVRSSKASISRICLSTTVAVSGVAPDAGAGWRAAEKQRRRALLVLCSNPRTIPNQRSRDRRWTPFLLRSSDPRRMAKLHRSAAACLAAAAHARVAGIERRRPRVVSVPPPVPPHSRAHSPSLASLNPLNLTPVLRMWPHPGAACSDAPPPQLSALPASRGCGAERKPSDEEESALQQARHPAPPPCASDVTRHACLPFTSVRVAGNDAHSVRHVVPASEYLQPHSRTAFHPQPTLSRRKIAATCTRVVWRRRMRGGV